MAKKELSAEEKKNNDDFLLLCKYIETEIFNYAPNMKLQKKAVLRLRGLSKGQIVANNRNSQYGEYPYEVILLTFKANKLTILNAIRGKNFESEENKVAYISAIVRDKLNDMYSRYLNAKKTQEKTESIDTDIIEYQGAEYQSRNKNTENNDNKYKGLW